MWYGPTLTILSYVREELTGRSLAGNYWYSSFILLFAFWCYKSIYITVIMLVFNGRETWSLTLREEHKLRVFEDRVLTKMFGPERNEVTGGCRKLQNEKLNDLYCSPSAIRLIRSKRTRWVGQVTHLGERRNKYRVLFWDLKERGRLKHYSIGCRIILKWGFKTEMDWLRLDLYDRIGKKGGLMCTRLWTLRFRNMRVVFSLFLFLFLFLLDEELLVSEEGLPAELFSYNPIDRGFSCNSLNIHLVDNCWNTVTSVADLTAVNYLIMSLTQVTPLSGWDEICQRLDVCYLHYVISVQFVQMIH